MVIEEKKIPVTGEKVKIEFVTTEEDKEKEKDIVVTEEPEEDIPEEILDALDGEPTVETPVPMENGIDRFNALMRSFFRPGTFTCGAFGVLCGGAAAVCCLTLGFWPTLLLGGAVGIGGFLGGASREKGHLMDKLKKRMNK